MSVGSIFTLLIVNPIINFLLLFYFVFLAWNIPGALGFAIILLTIFIRLIFHPFYKKQMEMSTKLQEVKPLLDELTEKYKDDKQKLQQEQMRLYQEKGINPAGGCLVAIIQIPIFLALYQVLQMFLETDSAKIISKVNDIAYYGFLKISAIDSHFFMFDLKISPSHYKEYGIYYLLIPLITAGLQYVQTLAQPLAPQSNAVDKDGKKKEDDMQTIMSKQMKVMLPLMIGYFSYILPVGLALYWNAFSLLTIIQSKPWKKKNK